VCLLCTCCGVFEPMCAHATHGRAPKPMHQLISQDCMSAWPCNGPLLPRCVFHLDVGVGLAGVWAQQAVAFLTAVPCPAHLTQHRRTVLHTWSHHRHVNESPYTVIAQWQSATLAMLKSVMQHSRCNAGSAAIVPDIMQGPILSQTALVFNPWHNATDVC
jgi:hypothetical protein